MPPMSSAKLFATKDNAEGALNASISAAALSIGLQSGDGANFPQPYNGTATSGGTSTTLNCTGILAAIGSGAAGKFIHNVTDGSVALIKTVATNSLTTTPLYDGSDNTWQNGDAWRIDEFVATFAKVDADGNITQSEQALIIARSTDTLTVATGGRGYNSTVANTFDADDSVFLFVTSPILERLKDYLASLVKQLETDETTLATHTTDIDNLESNATFYVAAAGSSNAFTGTLASMPAAYTAGERLYFKANHTITGSASFNRASLGAKTIKKLDGATNLDAGDIVNGQLVEIIYDGTNYLMLSPVANTAVSDYNCLYVASADSTTVNANTTSDQDLDVSYAIASSVWGVGTAIHLRAAGTISVQGSSTNGLLKVKLGSTVIGTITFPEEVNTKPWALDCWIICRTTGASGVIQASTYALGTLTIPTSSETNQAIVDDQNVTGLALNASITLKLSAAFSAASASNNCKITNFIVTKVTA